MFKRLRRNRKSPAIRSLVRETRLDLGGIIAPLFLKDGAGIEETIEPLPGVYRYSIDRLLKRVEFIHRQGIGTVALFPQIDPLLKCAQGKEAWNEKGLIPRAIRSLKQTFPELLILADVALDPYTSHGHDGLCNDKGAIINDATVRALVQQALVQAEAGADILAPSDMMDGRIRMIRKALDEQGWIDVNLLSYCAKYASSFYDPFRSAIKTKLAFGDKRTYQMDPANRREALLEAQADEEEGADLLMVKPALPYLDVIAAIRCQTHLPVGAYHVSGEYAMVMAAAEKGMLDAQKALIEQLICIKRAGAQFIYTYAIDQLLCYFKKEQEDTEALFLALSPQ